MDHVAAELLLPLDDLLTALFIGSVCLLREAGANAEFLSQPTIRLWRASLPWIAPTPMLAVLGILAST